ncbi:uncharacterized protein LOC119985356 [Tripterygium wilfordii]|nr:uncharacterized protein LOC119985356 [Tripterygium wilfordii]
MKRRRGNGHGSRLSKKKKQRVVNQQQNSTNWLLFPKKNGETGYISTATTPPSPHYRSRVRRFSVDLTDKKVWNCCYGWLILSDKSNLRFSLWNPATSKVIDLPELFLKPIQSIQQAVLFSNRKG